MSPWYGVVAHVEQNAPMVFHEGFLHMPVQRLLIPHRQRVLLNDVSLMNLIEESSLYCRMQTPYLLRQCECGHTCCVSKEEAWQHRVVYSESKHALSNQCAGQLGTDVLWLPLQ